MWGIIATWRMAVEGISEASELLECFQWDGTEIFTF